MKNRVLVVFHVYYESFVSYYLRKLESITDVDWDLVVTGHNLSERIKVDIRAFKPDAKFLESSNVGYDVWPFIYAIKNTDLSAYDFVIKIHTKNQDDVVTRLNGRKVTGAVWRSRLINVLIGDPERFAKLCTVFAESPKVGLAYAMDMDFISKMNSAEDASMLHKELQRLEITPRSMHFCGGTMFAVRAEALSWLKDERIDENVFKQSTTSHQGGTMAHVYERILSIGVTAQGYKTYLISRRKSTYIYMKSKRLIQPALEWIFSLYRKGEDRTKYLRIFGINIKLEENKI